MSSYINTLIEHNFDIRYEVDGGTTRSAIQGRMEHGSDCFCLVFSATGHQLQLKLDEWDMLAKNVADLRKAATKSITI